MGEMIEIGLEGGMGVSSVLVMVIKEENGETLYIDIYLNLI